MSVKEVALRAVTEATCECVVADWERHKALQRRAERRRDAMAAGASVAEIQAAIRAGHEEGNAKADGHRQQVD